jgi:hypothetical protein
MTNTPGKDADLDARQLEQTRQQFEKDLEFRREELAVKRKQSRWTNPAVAAAIVAGLASAFGYALSDRQAKSTLEQTNREFCYKVLSEHLGRNPVGGPNRASTELSIVAGAIDDKAPCAETLREVANSVLSAAPEIVPKPPDAINSAACGGIQSIRELGWREGHKTNYCIAKGFNGVFNPYGDYSAGGFCYRGPVDACLTEIKKESSK